MKKFITRKRLVAVVFGAILLLAFWGYWNLNRPLSIPPEGLIYEVQSGASLQRVSRDLGRRGYLHFPHLLVVYGRLSGRTVIHLGEYQLAAGINALELLDKLNRGEVIQHQVTLVEGKTFRQALQALWQSEKLQSRLMGLGDEAIRQRLDIQAKHLEGQFFPDTYAFTAGMSDEDILRQAHEKMQSLLEEEWQQRDENLPYKNPYEALIMASIVEKETGVPEERSAIAGVFVRRLQRGMKLQTDPTVIYGLGASYAGNITRKHLQQDTPYNTYTRYGLPPTPIALVGREALHAALHPLAGDDLFFVGKGDGHHYFSATLAEHEKAVRQYQLTRKKDYHSTPTTP